MPFFLSFGRSTQDGRAHHNAADGEVTSGSMLARYLLMPPVLGSAVARSIVALTTFGHLLARLLEPDR